MPDLFLVTGVPGAGKTTVSRLLAQRFERGVHVEADALQMMMVSGRCWPGEEPHSEAMRQLDLRARGGAALAATFFDGGFTTVIDDVIVGPLRLGIYRRVLAPRPLRLVVLAPPGAVALARDALRGEDRVGEAWAHLDGELRRKLRGVGLWLDNAGLTPDETVDAVLAPAALERALLA